MKYTFWEVLADIWPVLILAYVAGVVLTPLCRYLAHRWDVVDRPDNLLKTHARTVAYLGGLAVYISFVLALVAMGMYYSQPWLLLAAIGASSTIITVTGLLDDLLDLRPRYKILGQALSALVLYGGLFWYYQSLGQPRGFYPAGNFWEPLGVHLPAWFDFSASLLLAIVLVIAATNATNLLDGLDGLCGGVSGIMALAFAALAVLLACYGRYPDTDRTRVLLALAMAGAVLGFLPYNIPPASIFLGDAGSMLLGFFVAVMMLLFSVEGTVRWLLASCVIFGLPIIDTGLTVVRRALAGVNIFTGDRSHLYDQLVDRGLSVPKVVGLFYLLAVVAAVVGILQAHYLQVRYALPLDLAMLGMVAAIFIKTGMIRQTRGHSQA